MLTNIKFTSHYVWIDAPAPVLGLKICPGRSYFAEKIVSKTN